MAEYPKTPNCDKAGEIREQSQAVGEFIEWIAAEKKVNFMVWREDMEEVGECLDPQCDEGENRISRKTCKRCGGTGERKWFRADYVHFPMNIYKVLAEFFGIDYDEMEREKQAVLAHIRAVAAAPEE